MIYLKLLWSFFQIGLFSIGGGYAAMPLIEQQAVTLNGWLSEEGFADLVTIAEMTPGPIALNAATFVGMQVAGFPGALVATFGCVLPSTSIVFLMLFLYYRFRNLSVVQSVLSSVRPVVIALIASAGVTLCMTSVFGSNNILENWKNPNYLSIIIIIGALFALWKFKIKPIYVMLGSGAVYGIAHIVISAML